MKALVKARAEAGLWMETRPVPDIGPEDVLIKVRKTGICGTDVHIWNWDEWAERTVRETTLAGKGSFYIPSLSCRTIIYKGLLLAEQLAEFSRHEQMYGLLDLRQRRAARPHAAPGAGLAGLALRLAQPGIKLGNGPRMEPRLQQAAHRLAAASE